MNKTFLVLTIGWAALVAHSIQATEKNTLRAPAYPLVTIDPYTSAWAFTDNLYDGSVKHWTDEDFPLLGAISVDGQIYRFMGNENSMYKLIAKAAGEQAWTGAYTFQQPASDWYLPEFNDQSWKRGKAAFGTKRATAVRTLWENPNREIWVRREIKLSAKEIANRMFLHYSNDDDAEIYINGVEVLKAGCCGDGKMLTLPEKALKTLKPGRNVIAMHCVNTAGEALIDVGLSAAVPVENKFVQTARQTSADVQATQTHYTFACGPVNLELTFTAPLLLDNLNWVSRPVNYITYRVTPNDATTHEVKMYFEAAPAWALNKPYQDSRAEKITKNGLTYLKTGSVEQTILGKKGDNVRIDWGYFYLCGQETPLYNYLAGKPLDLRKAFTDNKMPPSPTGNSTNDHLAIIHSLGKISKATESKIMLGYDDIYSIQYFGENLRPYWNSDGSKTIFDAFEQATDEYDRLMQQCAAFDEALMQQATRAGGKKYAELCALVYRQAISAHKLVKAPNGDLLFLSKENFSNGSIGTVDVTYPSAPLFLLYNPELCKGLLNHIFYYSESGKWKKPFAAHDVGTYPIANGQTYGGDMPIEESGNMLILTAAIADAEGNANYAAKHWDVLTTWTNYLVANGLDPENQLCTDDFAGHFAHNTNLSIKAILAIASYGKLAKMLGKKDVAAEYTAKAKDMAKQWIQMANDGDHYRLTFDKPGTWSQKYNLVWDKLLKMNIFPTETADKEIAFYLTKQNTYGLPLDNRETYTKADWIIWTATLANSKASFEKFIDPLHKFANETVSRVPMTDWYWTNKPNQRGFQARSVVGGFFIKMMDKGNLLQLPRGKEKTAFQTSREWKPVTDTRADVAIVYGVGGNPSDRTRALPFEDRVQSWRDKGYATHFMTGIAWGEYQDYFTGKWDGKRHLDEGQVTVKGDTIWHGRMVPYIVPSKNFLRYMKEKHVKRVIDAGIDAIFMEETEFWMRGGYSEAFKREWQEYYGFPWRPQHETPENTYLANKLKYHLYYRALEDVFTYAKEYGKSKSMDVRCYVPTHSLVNYSSWQIVSPEASLASLPCVDGYIAQVWTGTSREKTFYNGLEKERVFENAFLEYGSMESMTRPTGRKMFFLTDPIEDWPRDWVDYKKNYQATFSAQLLYPTIADYEVMPWPDRIYEGLYKTCANCDTRERIPRFYSTQMQVMINTLNDMPLSDNRLNGSQGIGVLMSNSLMFQRFPNHKGYEDPQFSNFYGQTLPLLKRGIPVSTVHIENTGYTDTWNGLKVLIMSYSNMKPMKPEYHANIAQWVKNGCVLVYCGSDIDPYQSVMEWWNSG